MKLLYTVRYGAAPGNCGGDLRLFFTALNPGDWTAPPAAPPPGMWQVAPGVPEVVKLPSGDTIGFSLYVVTAGIPGRLFLQGAISVTTSTGVTFNQPIGQAPNTLFVPQQPALAIMQGRHVGPSGPLHFDVGFDLAVPWDGVSADCSGNWW